MPPEEVIDPALASIATVNQGTNPWVVTPSTGSITAIRQEPSQQVANGNAYAFGTAAAAFNIGAAELAAIYIKNNNASKALYIFNAFLLPDPSSANWLLWRTYYNPTVSANGTALTLNNLLAGSANTSGANAYTNPTASAFGKLVSISANGFSNSSSNPEISQFAPYLVLPAAQSLLVTAAAKGANTNFYANFQWFEI